jgi:hypothetical protein
LKQIFNATGYVTFNPAQKPLAGGALLAGWGLTAMVLATAVRAVVGRGICRRAYLQQKLPGDNLG